MIILKREPEARKKGYFRVTVNYTEDEVLNRSEVEQLFPGLFEESLDLIVSEEVLFRRRLLAGDTIDYRELAELLAADELVKARDAALRFLDYKMRTRSEVAAKLKDNGFSDKVIEETIGAIEKYGFLNDSGYAKAYSKERIRQRGARVIEHELQQKGIDKEFTRELLDEMKEDEEEAALAACSKKYQSLLSRGLDEQKLKDKVYRFLISRGYDYELIKKVYNTTLESTKDK